MFAGQPVALVIAETEAAAEDGAELLVVDYEPLEAVVDVEAAMETGAPLARIVEESDDEGGDLESVHGQVDKGQEDDAGEQLSGNVLDRVTREHGDVVAAFAASDAVVEGTFRTPWVYQAYIEPQVCTAWLEPSGTLVVSTSTQGSFVTRRELARAFDLPLERVRVIAEPLGGAFGGKFALVEPLAVGAALALQRPVRLVLTRSEDFAATNPASAQVTHLKVGARADGTLTAIEARMIVDRGTNAGWGVEGGTSLLVAGPYRWQAHDLRGYGVQTNRFTFGAYRAPGAPTAAFALESLLDELAQKLDLDPIELRLKNAVVEGDVGVSGSPFPTIGAVEVLERLREHPLWAQRDSLPDGEGVGMAAGHWPGAMEPASAVCRVDADGTMTVVTSVADMSGVNSGFAVIAAAAFGLSPDQVRVVTADTASAPYAGASGGSKITYTVGPAVLRAAEAAREKLLAAASQELEIAPDDLEVVDGVVQAVGAPDRSITVQEVASKALRFGGRYEPIEGLGDLGADERRALGGRAPLARARRPRDGRGDGAAARHRAGRRPRAQPGARRGTDARRRGAGHRLGALRAARPRRGRPPAHRLVPRLRDPHGGARPRDRHAHRGGTGSRRTVRREGHRRGAGRGCAGGGRERGRAGCRHPPVRAADDAAARLAGSSLVTALERAQAVVEPGTSSSAASYPRTRTCSTRTRTSATTSTGMVGSYDELTSVLDRYGFAGAFMFCLDEPDREPAFTAPNDRTLAHAERSGGRSFPFVRLDLTAQPLEEARRCLDLGARGIKLHPRAQAFALNDERLQPVFALAVERSVPILIHGGRGLPPIAEDLEALVRRNEGVKLIVAHAGIADMAGLAGRLGGISGVFFDTSVWSGLDLLDLYRQVAPEQVMYASDYPYGRQPNSLLVATRTAKLAGFDDKQLRLMLGGARAA